MHVFTVLFVLFNWCHSVIYKSSFNLYKQAKREPGLGFGFPNITLRPSLDVLDNIVPANQLCKIM